jgi:hypothetical protein
MKEICEQDELIFLEDIENTKKLKMDAWQLNWLITKERI